MAVGSVYMMRILKKKKKDTFPRSSRFVEAAKCPVLTKPDRTQKQTTVSPPPHLCNIFDPPSIPLLHLVITLSCLKKHSILSSLKTLLQETRFWKTLGIFFKATLRPSRGSVTDLTEKSRTRYLDTRKKSSFPVRVGLAGRDIQAAENKLFVLIINYSFEAFYFAQMHNVCRF